MATIRNGATYARVDEYGRLVTTSMIPITKKEPNETLSFAATVVNNKFREPLEHLNVLGVKMGTIRTRAIEYGWEHQYIIYANDSLLLESIIDSIEHELGAVDIDVNLPKSVKVRGRIVDWIVKIGQFFKKLMSSVRSFGKKAK